MADGQVHGADPQLGDPGGDGPVGPEARRAVGVLDYLAVEPAHPARRPQRLGQRLLQIGRCGDLITVAAEGLGDQPAGEGGRGRR